MMPALCSLINIILNPILQRKFGRKIMLTGPLLLSGILIVIAAFAIPKVSSYTLDRNKMKIKSENFRKIVCT